MLTDTLLVFVLVPLLASDRNIADYSAISSLYGCYLSSHGDPSLKVRFWPEVGIPVGNCRAFDFDQRVGQAGTPHKNAPLPKMLK